MTFDYLVGSRTSGANAFKIFEQMEKFNPELLATKLRSLSYPDFLNTAYWFSVSHVCKSRAGMRCQVCNSHDRIQVHHRTYDTHGREHLNMIDLVVLCFNCHGLFHGHMEVEPIKLVRTQITEQEVRTSGKSSVQKPPRQKLIPHTEEEIGLPDGESFVMTFDLINKCRVNGAFTNATLRSFGMSNPLLSGWGERLIGKVMSRAEYRSALEGRFIYGERLKTRKPKMDEFGKPRFSASEDISYSTI